MARVVGEREPTKERSYTYTIEASSKDHFTVFTTIDSEHAHTRIHTVSGRQMTGTIEAPNKHY